MGEPYSNSETVDRVRTLARQEVGASPTHEDGTETGATFPAISRSSKTNEAGGLDEKTDRRGSASRSSARKSNGGGESSKGVVGGGDGGGDIEAAPSDNFTEKSTPAESSPPAASQDKSEAAGNGDPTLGSSDSSGSKQKKPIGQRMSAGSMRFLVHLKSALFSSWVNVLLVFVPIGIAADAAGLSPGIIFGMNAIAIIPLAGLLAHATEAVAARLGDTLGALLNVSFGNAVELIIFIIALVKNEIAIVQASLLGSILANLLLILGMAFLFGGLRYREQVYNSTVTQMSACLLSLSVMSLLLPTAFYASFSRSSGTLADKQVLKVSRGVSVVLLLVYVLYLLFQLKSHAYMYESTPQEIIDEESHPGVLADMLNSSSSSDTSSSSSSDDSDSSDSGSVAAAGKKIKRVFKNRRRRKSSASVSSTNGSAKGSALSSPSTQERGSNYWESKIGSKTQSRRGSTLGALPSEMAGNDADHEDNSLPRVRDFVDDHPPSSDVPKASERKKHRSKKWKKREKKRRHERTSNSSTQDDNIDILGLQPVASPTQEEDLKVVAFADGTNPGNPQHTDSGSSPFNLRQLSALRRPALPKMLSNNVFVQPPPQHTPVTRPSLPNRTVSTGSHLRRASSLPDRLNRQTSNTGSRAVQLLTRTDPLPPFQHQRQLFRQAQEEVMVGPGDEESKPVMSRTAAVVLLLGSTCLVAVCAEFMVAAIPAMIASSPNISQAFIGLIILPIVGNAAEHVTAVTVAAKNKMDLAIGVAVGSSIQIALFVTPVVVLLGWILHTDMSLYFNLFETISLFVTAFVVNFLVLDGRSNYLEGSLLIAAYVIIALGAFFYPAPGDQSQVGGGEG